MIKSFPPQHSEVTKFREKIFCEDLNLEVSLMSKINFQNSTNYHKYAYWFSDNKFLNNGFDQVLLYFSDNQPVALCGGTHYNKNLYRSTQMLYTLRSAVKSGFETLHFRDGGFFDYQIQRAQELNCKGIFISIDPFDKSHYIIYRGTKTDKIGFNAMKTANRKYASKDFIWPEKKYKIKNVDQLIIYKNLINNVDNFDELFNDS